MTNNAETLIEINNLHTYFHTEAGIVKAVDGVGFKISQGDTLAIVGESGCGKSMTALSIMRLVPSPGKIESGEINFEGKNFLRISNNEMRKIRGNKISIIFQDPMTSLNPVLKVGKQVSEVISLHQGLSKEESMKEAIKLLENLGLPDPEVCAYRYPFQLSGGMRQRVMIAIAVSCQPKLLIADEPTTALDVTVQYQILDIMRNLQKEYQSSIIFITHDMGVVAEIATNVCVMYAGRIVETASVEDMFDQPSHPYTVGLLQSMPRLDKLYREKLETIPGVVPNLLNLPKGCKFHPRCSKRMPQCMQEEPPLFQIGDHHDCRCWLFESKENKQ